MAEALRILSLALPVPDLAAAEKFYRWVLAMRDAASSSDRGLALGWGKEDRIELIDSASKDAEESVTLGLPAMTIQAVAGWLAERDLVPTEVLVPTSQLRDAQGAWPRAAIDIAPREDHLLLTLRGEIEPRIDLYVPLPDAVTAPESTEAAGSLEVPGILGMTTGASDLRTARAYLASLGIEPLERGAEEGPLRVGNQQWIVEEREPGGIYGIAVVIELERIKDLLRTLERIGVEHRHERNRLIALDPAGRVLLVHGLKGG